MKKKNKKEKVYFVMHPVLIKVISTKKGVNFEVTEENLKNAIDEAKRKGHVFI